MKRLVVVSLAVFIALLSTAAGPSAASTRERGDGPRNGWVQIASLSEPRFHSVAASGAKGVYILGGDLSEFICSLYCNVTNTVEYYDPSTDTWSHVAPMQIDRDWPLATTGLDGTVYALGGFSQTQGTFLAAAEAYSPTTNTWSYIAPMPEAGLAGGAATGADGRIYVIGGWSNWNQPTTTVMVYAPSTDTWTYAGNLLEPLAFSMAATGPDGRIYALGANAQVYDPATDSWSYIALEPHPRGYGAASAGADGKIYAMGECCGPDDDITVEAYDPKTDTWATGPPMITPRGSLGAALGGDGRIYTVGGGFGERGLSNAEALATTCQASVQVEGNVHTPGSQIAVQVHIAHHRPKTVTVPWELSLIDASGQVVLKHTTAPITFEPGDVVDRNVEFRLPDDLASGTYTLELAISGMAGTKGATTTFRVIQAE